MRARRATAVSDALPRAYPRAHTTRTPPYPPRHAWTMVFVISYCGTLSPHHCRTVRPYSASPASSTAPGAARFRVSLLPGAWWAHSPPHVHKLLFKHQIFIYDSRLGSYQARIMNIKHFRITILLKRLYHLYLRFRYTVRISVNTLSQLESCQRMHGLYEQ